MNRNAPVNLPAVRSVNSSSPSVSADVLEVADIQRRLTERMTEMALLSRQVRDVLGLYRDLSDTALAVDFDHEAFGNSLQVMLDELSMAADAVTDTAAELDELGT